jgi:hypothetical protein
MDKTAAQDRVLFLFLSFKGMKYELGVGIHHHSRRNEGTFFKKREKNTNELKTVSLL